MPEKAFVYTIPAWNYRSLAEQTAAPSYAAVQAARSNYVELLAIPFIGLVAGWNEISVPRVKVGSAYRQIIGGWVRAGGQWKRFYTGTPFVARVDEPTVTPDPLAPPPPPTGAVQGVVGERSVEFSWSPVPESGLYRIYRDGIPVGMTAEVQFTDRYLTPGATHVYTMTSVSLAGEESEHLWIGTAVLGTPSREQQSSSGLLRLRPVSAGSFRSDGLRQAQVGQGWYMDPTHTLTGYIDFGPPELIDLQIEATFGFDGVVIDQTEEPRLLMRQSIFTGSRDGDAVVHASAINEPVGTIQPDPGTITDDIPVWGGDLDVGLAVPNVGTAIVSKEARTVVFSDDTHEGWVMFNGLGSPDSSCMLEILVAYTVVARAAVAGRWL